MIVIVCRKTRATFPTLVSIPSRLRRSLCQPKLLFCQCHISASKSYAHNVCSYAGLLPGSRCLLITRDRAGDGRIYTSSITTIQDAVYRRATKELKRDKIGENILLAYDESKRILAICSTSGVSR